MTLGDRGCRYYLGSEAGELPGFKVPEVDTTGAGDSFLAGFLSQLVQRGTALLSSPVAIKEALTYANAVAALTVTQTGAMVLSNRPKAIAAQPILSEVVTLLGWQL